MRYSFVEIQMSVTYLGLCETHLQIFMKLSFCIVCTGSLLVAVAESMLVLASGMTSEERERYMDEGLLEKLIELRELCDDSEMEGLGQVLELFEGGEEDEEEEGRRKKNKRKKAARCRLLPQSVSRYSSLKNRLRRSSIRWRSNV